MPEYIAHDRRGRHPLKVTIGGRMLIASSSDERMVERIDLDRVAVMRLNPPVSSRYSPGHYLCTLVGDRGEKLLLRAEADSGDACRDYARLIHDLHALLLARAQPPRFMTGLASPLAFWLFVLVFASLLVLLTWAAIHGMARKKNYAVGIVFVVACFGAAAWFLRFAWVLLHPSAYDPKHAQALVPARKPP